MTRLSSCVELRQLGNMLRADVDPSALRIVICAGTACRASRSADIIQAAQGYILENGLVGKVALKTTGCHGFCEMGPFLLTEPQQAFYAQVKIEHVPQIIRAAFEGRCVEELLYRDSRTGEVCRNRDDVPFFKNQRRSILAMNQKVDPTRIHDYITEGGYLALEKALSSLGPTGVVEQIKQSGLRGRGGGGFPTGLKWEMLAKQPGPRGKVLVCNADEGDPGAYMDRCILEGNPHSIIEGMIIGAYGTGADEGIVYVRHEYPLAIENLNFALHQARDYGLLGNNILGEGFSFDIRVVRGAGAFVCGEETALIRSIEGKRGEPCQRPPYPVQKGGDGKPTIINNVETWANIPIIIRQGAEEFAKVGTKNNSGTKIFSLVGKIKNTGLVEVPMGITIREIVNDIGGGPAGDSPIKAVQTGGPSGGCIPVEKFELTVDYDSLAVAGSIMGSGGMIVMDENTCMVDVAKYFMNFLKEESCGKCFTCRKGTQRMYELLDDVTKGRGTLEHLDLLEELAQVVKDTTLCGLGQTAGNPVLSTLRYFRKEFERHVIDKRCDAFVCGDLVGAACQTACPLDTEAWRYVALLEKGQYEEAYQVVREANPFPSVCARVCDHRCESRCQLGQSGGEPIAIRALKRFITDRVDPGVYKPAATLGRQLYCRPAAGKQGWQYNCHPNMAGADRADVPSAAKRSTGNVGTGSEPVAVVGGGPAGISAAHYLSLQGYKVTLFEAEDAPGGMLTGGIPAYRLPRDLIEKEIASLLGEDVTVRCGVRFGQDIALDSLTADGFHAVFLAIGAHESRPLGLEGDRSDLPRSGPKGASHKSDLSPDLDGVYPSMRFLKAFNLRGEELARGQVGVIGGGNSAVDAARVAIRQKDVQSVTLFYRRTEQEMPAYEEEIEAAREEGVKIEVLVSPQKLFAKDGRLDGMECIRNRLGKLDAGGRPRPVPEPGTEFAVHMDTLIVAIGEQPAGEILAAAGLELNKNGSIKIDPKTFRTSRDGVFAGGDVATGPATVVDAIAAGKKAAEVIDRYLRGESLTVPPEVKLPRVFIEPAVVDEEQQETARRAKVRSIPPEARRKNFAAVEKTLSEEEAVAEAQRCLRCDLQFTCDENGVPLESVATEEKSA
ncbi:MAG: FAD-dependent oxidoreductase [Planctomycetes bacterium]|nr:FAD-dependent oxidoreductase [Planctomycetota bacterium]